jgi:general secretion pathway protein G
MRRPACTRRNAPTTGSRSGATAGFTIIELIVVLVVLSVLALSVLPVAELSVRRAKERELRFALVEIRQALDAYKHAVDDKKISPGGPQSGYPPTLVALVEGAPAAGNSNGTRMYFLRRIPRDPFAPESVAAQDTWALRSYESPPDRPTPGADVYDVYSMTPGTGLNGIPYRQW